MRKSAFKTFTLLSAMVLALVLNSCESKDSDNFENDLYGTWTLDKMEFSELKIGDVDVIQFLKLSFGYSQEEAEAALDSIFSDIGTGISELAGTVAFMEDYTYVVSLSDEDEKGEWSLSDDGKMLSLQNEKPEEDLEELEIESLTASMLVIIDEFEEAEADFDGDGEEETELSFTIRMIFTK